MRFSPKHFFLLVIFALSTGTIMAQAVTKEVFNSAVDHINCETIRFIHREAGRAEVANNMDCLSFESIYKSIPADETGTTGALCKNINDYKNKFKEDKPLDAQLNAVIAFANAKIGAKKRKGNVEDFKASLEKIKKDALDEANGTATAANKTSDDSKPSDASKKDDKAASAADTGQAIAEPAAGAAKPAHKTDWLGLLSLLVGLGALGLAYMAYSGIKKIQGGSMHPISTTYGNKAIKDDAMQEIQRVEKHFKAEIANLNKLIDDMVKTGPTVSNQAPAATPEPIKQETTSAFMHETQEMEPEHQEERNTESERDIQADEAELVATPEDKVNTNEPELIPDPEEEPYIERDMEMEMEPEIHKESNHENEPSASVNETPSPNLFETIPTPSSDLFSAGSPRTEPVAQNPVTSFAPPSPQPVQERGEAEPFMPEKEYEDGEAVPFYKFVGLPNAEGYFDANSFADDPGQDSVYELEMYEDVPNKAFFSIRSNPDIIRRAIQNPQVYLAPCCSFTEDPAGKHAIVLVEEGMLRKENDKWIVYEKAKISFE